MSRSHTLAWTLILFAAAAPCAAQTERQDLGLAVLYAEGDTGARMNSGVRMAQESDAVNSEKYSIQVTAHPYLDENGGIETLLQLLEDPAVHVILGPTDSGVFVNVADRAAYQQASTKKPIVSPIVTAPVGNTEGEWRFRTNIDVGVRVRAIADYLAQSGYQSIGVLYRTNEFGQTAADSFMNQLADPSSNYTALPYRDTVQLREQVRRILETRPGAVGVFGQRHELRTVRRELNSLNSSLFSYTPVIFTIIDARALELPDTFFVSLFGAPEETIATTIVNDEVRALAHDTAIMVAEIADDVSAPLGTAEWSETFRKRFFTRMSGPPQPVGSSITPMAFSDGKNLTRPTVLVQTSAGIEEAVAGHSWAVGGKLADWIEIRQRRFGAAIWINVALVAVVSLWLTLSDIRRRRTTRLRTAYLNKPVLTLVFFNVASAVIALVAAAESGLIRWDSVLAALGVAVGHRAVLKTTLFETAQGRALGFGQLYERKLASINERIGMTLYEAHSPAINYIAYTNSLPNLRQVLTDYYGFDQANKAERESKLAEIDAEIRSKTELLEKQKVCARYILEIMTWSQVQSKRLIPDYIKEGDVIDPEIMLRDCVQSCLQQGRDMHEHVREKVDEALEEVKRDSVKAHDSALEKLTAKVAGAQTERGRLYWRLRWLFTQYSFSTARIREAGLEPGGGYHARAIPEDPKPEPERPGLIKHLSLVGRGRSTEQQNQ